MLDITDIVQNFLNVMAQTISLRIGDSCPVHLPEQNIFRPGQNIFCTGQNNFCPRQNIFVPDKKFCPKLKSTFLLVKWMENNFLAMEKNFSTA